MKIWYVLSFAFPMILVHSCRKEKFVNSFTFLQSYLHPSCMAAIFLVKHRQEATTDLKR